MDTATTANMDPVVMSTTTAISGNRDATPPIPGGARDGFVALLAGLLVMGFQALGAPITDVYALVLSAALFGLFTTARKAIANARVKHGK